MINLAKICKKAEVKFWPQFPLKKGVRGGVSNISKRYSKANNKYLKSYDPKQESKHYILGRNNLYG